SRFNSHFTRLTGPSLVPHWCLAVGACNRTAAAERIRTMTFIRRPRRRRSCGPDRPRIRAYRRHLDAETVAEPLAQQRSGLTAPRELAGPTRGVDQRGPAGAQVLVRRMVAQVRGDAHVRARGRPRLEQRLAPT